MRLLRYLKTGVCPTLARKVDVKSEALRYLRLCLICVFDELRLAGNQLTKPLEG